MTIIFPCGGLLNVSVYSGRIIFHEKDTLLKFPFKLGNLFLIDSRGKQVNFVEGCLRRSWVLWGGCKYFVHGVHGQLCHLGVSATCAIDIDLSSKDVNITPIF